MLQSTQLPRPEPIRVIETKTAKTLANNSKKSAYHEDNSSKEGSLTEDSGVGSQVSADVVPGVERLNFSPTYGARRSFHKSRNLEIVRSGNSFDVRDLDDTSESCVPLPQLPSAFSTAADNSRGSVLALVSNVGLQKSIAGSTTIPVLSGRRRGSTRDKSRPTTGGRSRSRRRRVSATTTATRRRRSGTSSRARKLSLNRARTDSSSASPKSRTIRVLRVRTNTSGSTEARRWPTKSASP